MEDIPRWLWEYAEYIVKKYDFDSSHDMKHFVNVYNYAKEIISHDYPDLLELDIPISQELKEILPNTLKNFEILEVIYYSAFCHDLIDSKYVDPKEETEKLCLEFLKNGYPENLTDIIIFIINNMSYSKQKLGNLKIPKEYSLIMDIVCDADKLDAYRVERVIAYQDHKHKNLEEPEKTIINSGWIKTILVKRVLMYKDHWLKTNYAKTLSIPLHDAVQSYVDANLSIFQMYDY
jgi:HD superfamily phosphodiesterase